VYPEPLRLGYDRSMLRDILKRNRADCGKIEMPVWRLRGRCSILGR
jgi:hypothetical protein